jgi:hypothetical protein
MDLSIFEKTPQVAPLLVRLYDSHKLYNLLDDDQPLAKAEVTSAVAELLEVDLGPQEQELLADVLIGLMRQAELDLRQALADKLADLETVPLRLVLHLANDEISVAAPVLRNSPVFSDLDLIYIIKSQGADYWQAIASRAALSDRIIDVLAEKEDLGTAIVLTKNERVELTHYAIGILAGMAKESEVLAKPLLLREEVPEEFARDIYKHVGNELKLLIQNYYGINTEDVLSAVDDVILDFVEEPAETLVFMPTDKEISEANRVKQRGDLSFDYVLNELKKGEILSFVAAFTCYLDLELEIVYDALSQESGKKLAILCRAFGIMKGDFSTIFMMTQRIRTGDRIMDQGDLFKALHYFDRVKYGAARRIYGLDSLYH